MKKAVIWLMIFCIASLAHGKYLVWDKEDGVMRDYGSCTNYAKSLEEEKQILINENTTNRMIIHEQDVLINMYEKDRKQEKWIKVENLSLKAIILFFLAMTVRELVRK